MHEYPKTRGDDVKEVGSMEKRVNAGPAGGEDEVRVPLSRDVREGEQGAGMNGAENARL